MVKYIYKFTMSFPRRKIRVFSELKYLKTTKAEVLEAIDERISELMNLRAIPVWLAILSIFNF